MALPEASFAPTLFPSSPPLPCWAPSFIAGSWPESHLGQSGLPSSSRRSWGPPHNCRWIASADQGYSPRGRHRIMTAAALMGFALALMVAAGSPGPSIAALVARVLTSGLRDVLPFLAAM